MSCEVEGRNGVSATWSTIIARGCEARAAVGQHEGAGGPTERPANVLHIWIKKAEVPSKRYVSKNYAILRVCHLVHPALVGSSVEPALVLLNARQRDGGGGDRVKQGAVHIYQLPLIGVNGHFA